MLGQLSQHWWVFVVRGVLALLFGIGTFLMPGVTLAALIILYALYAFADGVVAVVAAFGRRSAGDGSRGASSSLGSRESLPALSRFSIQA